MKNKRISNGKLKHAFNRTANKTSSKNKVSHYSRGGIRL